MTQGPVALEPRDDDGARLFSPSAARNRDAIRDVFVRTMPSRGRILEIGSGTGEHVVHLAAALPECVFQPSDPDDASRASIAAWIAHAGLSNAASPLAIDVTASDWENAAPRSVDAVFSINMIHIAPFTASVGLFGGAARLLARGARLFLYGPFARDGAHTAPSNAAFDQSLKARDPGWGVRDLDREIIPLARQSGFRHIEIVAMPANNLSVIFERA